MFNKYGQAFPPKRDFYFVPSGLAVKAVCYGSESAVS